MTYEELYNIIISSSVLDIGKLPGVKFIKISEQYDKDSDIDNLKNWCINQYIITYTK